MTLIFIRLGGAGPLGAADSTLQLALPFDHPAISPETAAQRLAWERFVLGLPVSVTSLETITNPPAKTTPLAHLPELAGKAVTVLGYRLPGWTGGSGFYLGDGHTFVLARGSEALKSPPAWQPVIVRGRWLSDAFSTAWFQNYQPAEHG